MTYPYQPGHTDHDTSKAASDSMESPAILLRDECLNALMFQSMTADEAAVFLGKSILSIRPRFTELFNIGLIRDTGGRRKNASGRFAKVWGLA